MWETWVQSLGWEGPLEEEIATHSTHGKSHGQRNLVGYSPWGHKESDTTERLTHKDMEITLVSINRYMAEDVVYAITDGP